MSDNEESNDIEEPVEDDLRLIENDEDGTNGKETKNEELLRDRCSRRADRTENQSSLPGG